MFIASVVLQTIGLFFVTIAYGIYANDGVGSPFFKLFGKFRFMKWNDSTKSYNWKNGDSDGYLKWCEYCVYRSYTGKYVGHELHTDVDSTGQRLHHNPSTFEGSFGCQGNGLYVPLLRDVHGPVQLWENGELSWLFFQYSDNIDYRSRGD